MSKNKKRIKESKKLLPSNIAFFIEFNEKNKVSIEIGDQKLILYPAKGSLPKRAFL